MDRRTPRKPMANRVKTNFGTHNTKTIGSKCTKYIIISVPQKLPSVKIYTCFPLVSKFLLKSLLCDKEVK